MDGGGGTDSSQIADWIRANNFHGDLVIITDGQVGQSEIDRCTSVLGDSWIFASVTAHLIDTGGPVNLSVTCPFTRNGSSQVFTYMASNGYVQKSELEVSAASLVALAEIPSIRTVEEFEARYATLLDAIIVKTMGTTGNASLHAALVALKKHLVASTAHASSKSDSMEMAHASLREKNYPATSDAFRRICDEYYGGADSESWSAKIDDLISKAAGSLRSTFRADAARLSRATTASAASPMRVAVTEAAPDTTAPTFPCPISLDKERDLILLVCADGPRVFAGLDKGLQDLLLNNPLNALLHPEVVAKIVAWLDHPIGIASYQEAGGLDKSPMTRKDVLGGICLSPTEEACKATTWTLARILTGGKLAGNQDLWFAVLWMIIQKTEYLAHLEPFFREQMIFRLKHHTTFLSLGGRPEYVTTVGSLEASLWFVLNAGAQLCLPAARDPVRPHLTCVEPLLAVYNLTGHPLPMESRRHILRTRILESMLWASKKSNFKHLQQRINALYQAAICISIGVSLPDEEIPVWILCDGPAPPEQVATVLAMLRPLWKELPIEELVWLASKVHPNRSLGDLEVHGTAPALPAPTIAWNQVKRVNLAICKGTCRPPVTPKHWKVAATEIYGAETATRTWFSSDNHFAEFVLKYKCCPTVDEFLVYVYNREIVHGITGKTTLPMNVDQYAESVIADHKPLIDELGVDTYLLRRARSMDQVKRKTIEETA
jgi:hypothetical protein